MNIILRHTIIFPKVRFLSTFKTYTDTHEWYLKKNNNFKLGLSNKAIELMTDLVYIDTDSINIYYLYILILSVSIYTDSIY